MSFLHIRMLLLPDMRLINGSSPSYRQGLVEVFYNGIWGSVCDGDWDLDDAHVLCRSMGFGEASETPEGATFGRSSTNATVSNVQCRGNERSLFECSLNTNNIYNCTGMAGVTCSGELLLWIGYQIVIIASCIWMSCSWKEGHDLDIKDVVILCFFTPEYCYIVWFMRGLHACKFCQNNLLFIVSDDSLANVNFLNQKNIKKYLYHRIPGCYHRTLHFFCKGIRWKLSSTKRIVLVAIVTDTSRKINKRCTVLLIKDIETFLWSGPCCLKLW